MAYKKLSEATLVESVSEETNILIEENDEIKKIPVEYLPSGNATTNGDDTIKFYVDDDMNITETNITYAKLLEYMESGKMPIIILICAHRDEYSIYTGYKIAEYVELNKSTENFEIGLPNAYYVAVRKDGTMQYWSAD